MAEKAVSTAKELLISIVGLIIAIILAVFALGIADWGIELFGIEEEMSKAAALIAVACMHAH